MRTFIRSIPAVALVMGLGTATLAAQAPGNGNFQWYIGPQAGVTFFETPTQGRSGIPTFGGHTLIVAKRTGLLLSFDEAVGSNETSSYSDVNGVQNVTFNDIRKYSAMLMAFPLRSPVQPYLGIGWGIIHVVNPTPSSPGAFQSDAVELGSSGFGSFVGGVQFKLGRFMAFGQYQVTTSMSNKTVTASDGTIFAAGRLLEGPTHLFSGGLRLGLGSSRESVRTGGY